MEKSSSFVKVNDNTYEYVDDCYGRICFVLESSGCGRFQVSNEYVFNKSTLKEIANILNTLSKEVFGD
jgi:hypothetical protein